jgi:hypothetical protein
MKKSRHLSFIQGLFLFFIIFISVYFVCWVSDSIISAVQDNKEIRRLDIHERQLQLVRLKCRNGGEINTVTLDNKCYRQ